MCPIETSLSPPEPFTLTMLREGPTPEKVHNLILAFSVNRNTPDSCRPEFVQRIIDYGLKHASGKVCILVSDYLQRHNITGKKPTARRREMRNYTDRGDLLTQAYEKGISANGCADRVFVERWEAFVNSNADSIGPVTSYFEDNRADDTSLLQPVAKYAHDVCKRRKAIELKADVSDDIEVKPEVVDGSIKFILEELPSYTIPSMVQGERFDACYYVTPDLIPGTTTKLCVDIGDAVRSHLWPSEGQVQVAVVSPKVSLDEAFPEELKECDVN